MTARRSGAVAVVAVVACALLVLVLASWASAIGPHGVVNGPGPSPAPVPTTSTSPAVDGTGAAPVQGPHHPPTPDWVRTAALVVNILVSLVFGYLVLRYVVWPVGRWRVRHRRERRSARQGRADHGHDFTVLQPAEAVARTMLADADAQRALLLDGEVPGNAVIACWHRFETQGARAGVGRHPWETSSEYTMRVLDLVDAHQPAVARLGALYREARFSEHELTEEHRAEALAALDAIHHTVGLPA